MSRFRAAWVAAVAVCAGFLVPASPAMAQPRAVLALLPMPETGAPTPAGLLPTPPRTVLDMLDAHPELSLGLSSAVQGRYYAEQALLDITQGSRTSAAAYDPRAPTPLEFIRTVTGARMFGWAETKARAEGALADVVPGLLGSSIPGGVGYVGVDGREQREAIAAADRDGRIERARLTRAHDVADAVTDLLKDHRLVVAGLATGALGDQTVGDLIRSRAPGTLLIVMQSPPLGRAPQLLPTGIAGLPGGDHALTSSTTHQPGLIANIDVPVTILDHLGLPVPEEMKGQVIRSEGERDAATLRDLEARLKVISPRRFPALETMLAGWLAVLLLGGLFADRRGIRWAQRVGGLAFCWLLPVLLVSAYVAPSKGAELAIVVAGCFLLAILTDRLVAWPRAIAVPCTVAVLSYAVDLARSSDLIIRSLLGPNPRFGSRFYGLGNELEASLPVLLFLALAGILYGRARTRGLAATFGAAGLVLTGVVASGRLGADVGGVFTIIIGTAVCVLLLLPGGITRRAIAIAVVAPFLGLVALAALDLATGGDSHFTRSVLHADSSSTLIDTVTRRFELAFNVFRRGLMPFATILAALGIAYGVRYRDRIYAPVAGDPAWTAALWGGLAAGIAGTVFNDSGPMLLLFSTFVLLVGTSYIRGGDRPEVSATAWGADPTVSDEGAG